MNKSKNDKAWLDFERKMDVLRKKQLETLNKLSQRLADRKLTELKQKIK